MLAFDTTGAHVEKKNYAEMKQHLMNPRNNQEKLVKTSETCSTTLGEPNHVNITPRYTIN